VLSARVNLLTKTEQFDDAVWSKSAVTVSANTLATTDPLGGNTADLVYPTSSGADRIVFVAGSLATRPTRLTYHIKSAGFRWAAIGTNIALAEMAFFDLQNGVVGSVGASLGGAAITDMGNGWFRCSVTATSAATGTASTAIWVVDANGSRTATANGTSGIYIWGADLRVANDGVGLPAYQRVNTSTDYDTTGFPMYLRFDGVDDGMVTNSINFTSTDKMTVFAGVRKLSDAAAGMVAELSVNVNSNAGSFYFAAPEDLNNRYVSNARGVASPSQTQSATTGLNGVAPDTAVIAITHDIAGDLSTIRRNGVAGTNGTGDKGTGNFGNYPLFIGRRGGTTLPFNGRLHSLIVRGAQSTAGQITQTETFVNGKTKAY
jgi:hypothetical protein